MERGMVPAEKQFRSQWELLLRSLSRGEREIGRKKEFDRRKEAPSREKERGKSFLTQP